MKRLTVAVPVTCCPSCASGYDAAELRELTRAPELDKPGCVGVCCGVCRAKFRTSVEAYGEPLRLRDAESYFEQFPASTARRVIVDDAPRFPWAAAANVVALVLALVLLAWFLGCASVESEPSGVGGAAGAGGAAAESGGAGQAMPCTVGVPCGPMRVCCSGVCMPQAECHP